MYVCNFFFQLTSNKFTNIHSISNRRQVKQRNYKRSISRGCEKKRDKCQPSHNIYSKRVCCLLVNEMQPCNFSVMFTIQLFYHYGHYCHMQYGYFFNLILYEGHYRYSESMVTKLMLLKSLSFIVLQKNAKNLSLLSYRD